MKESIIKNVVLKDCASSTRNSGYCFTAILAKFNYGKISNCAISGGTSSTTSGNNSGTTMLCIENYGITEKRLSHSVTDALKCIKHL